MEHWEGRVALVNGASSSIGAAICRALVKHGMIVLGCGRNVEKIRAIANEKDVALARGHLHCLKCDVSKEMEVHEMFKTIREKFGCVDVCINNAGNITNSALMDGEADDWRTMMDVNVLGVCICTKESLTLMKENDIQDGQIIYMNSVIGYRIPIYQGDATDPYNYGYYGFYYGTRFMMRSIAESLRQQLKSEDCGIRVACISPGVVETEFMVRSMNSEIAEYHFGSATKCLQPKDIVDAVTYILSAPNGVNVEDIIMQPIEASELYANQRTD